MNIAVRLPELLELVDRFSARNSSFGGMDCILERLFSMDKDFCDWIAAYHQLTEDRYAYTAASTIDSCGQDEAPLRFSSFLSCNIHSLLWMCQVLLHAAVTQLIGSQSALEKIAECSVRSANQYARLLRGGIGFVLHAASGNVARASAVRLPLYVLRIWYERSWQSEQESECAELEASIRRSVPALQWDALIPWAFIPLITR